MYEIFEKAGHPDPETPDVGNQPSWGNIPEESPDEWDLKMLDSIKSDPDCREFISEQELLRELNL